MAGCPCMVRLEALCAHPGPGGISEFAGSSAGRSGSRFGDLGLG